jgi:acyl carrier protein
VGGLWRRILGVAPTSPEDDFFELGGHSLHAVQLLSSMRRAFRIDLPMAALFDATTLAGHASALTALEPAPGHLARAARALAALDAMSEEERARRHGSIGRPARIGSAAVSDSARSAGGVGAEEDA